MRYLCLIYLEEKQLAAMPESEMNALNARHLEYNDSLLDSGHFIEAEALEPAVATTCVRVRNGRTSLTDGPYAETKEMVAGFYVIEARDLNEAIQVASDTKLLADMMKYNEELVNAGIMQAGEGLQPSSRGARIKFSKDNKRTVVDGPFAETKELVAGFWLWKVKDREEAMAWAKRCPSPFPGEECEIEIRQVFEAEDFGAELTPQLREQEERLRERTARIN